MTAPHPARDRVVLTLTAVVVAFALLNAFVVLHEMPDQDTLHTWTTPIVVLSAALFAGVVLWERPTAWAAWGFLIAAAALVAVVGVTRAPDASDPVVWMVWVVMVGAPIACYALALTTPRAPKDPAP